MKEWEELTKLGKKRRLTKIYSMLDPETSEKVFEKYNSIDDADEDEFDDCMEFKRV